MPAAISRDGEAVMLDLQLWQERWSESLRLRQSSADTVTSYRAGLKLLFAFFADQGVTSLSEVNRELLEEYRGHLYARRTAQGKRLAPATQKARLGAAKAFFRYLVQEGYLAFDPSTSLELPLLRPELPAVLSEGQVVRLLETPDVATLQGVRDRAVLEVLYSTALRNGELCDLHCQHLDPEGLTLLVACGKGGKPRLVPLGEEAREWLETYLVRVRPHWLKTPTDRLFLGRRGRPLESYQLTRLVRVLAGAAGLGPHVTPHTLRHSCATHMLRRGAGLRQLQALLGHSSTRTTDHYTRVDLTDLRKVLRRCHPRERRR
jgi:integrase/recombinase XerD